MRRFLVLFTLSITIPTAGETLESRFLKRIARARTSAEVFTLERDYRELKESRAACQIQWRRRWVPLACYAVLKEELRQGFHGGNADKRRLTFRLDERCRETAAAIYLGSAPKPRAESLKPPVSAACRGFIENARKVEAYRSQANGGWSEY